MTTDAHVVAIFDDQVKARSALDKLVGHGIDSSKLSLLVGEVGKSHHFEIDSEKSKTAEGAGYGAVLGGLVAGLGAAAAGIVSVTVPGAILVTGPLGVALASGAIGAAAGGLTGALIGIGIPAEEVDLIENDLKDGSFMVGAHSITSEQASAAKHLLEAAGAVRVH